MMHGYYTNKFIIVIVCFGQMQVHNPNNKCPAYSIKRMYFICPEVLYIQCMYFLIIFIISYMFLPSDLLPSILRSASNCHFALCPNHFFCRCLPTVLQSTNTPFLPPIRLCRTLSFVIVPVQIICFTSSFVVTFQIPTMDFHNSFLCRSPLSAIIIF